MIRGHGFPGKPETVSPTMTQLSTDVMFNVIAHSLPHANTKDVIGFPKIDHYSSGDIPSDWVIVRQSQRTNHPRKLSAVNFVEFNRRCVLDHATESVSIAHRGHLKSTLSVPW